MRLWIALITVLVGGLRPAAHPERALPDQTGEVRARSSRGASISGRVVDEHGDPVPRANVGAYAIEPGPRGSPLKPLGSRVGTKADDDGAFTLAGLNGGAYILTASAFYRRDPPDATRVQTLTFYPGVASPQDAARVAVPAGGSVDDLEFPMLRVSVVSVSGAVVDVDGKIPGEAAVQLFWRDCSINLGISAITLADGTFVLDHVPAGRYIVQAAPVRRVNGARTWGMQVPSPDGRAPAVEIAVGSEPVTGLLVTMQPHPRARPQR
jgi:hypothetical protein